jgi:hypothetical protein
MSGKFGRTIFDDYDDKFTNMDFYLKNEIFKLEHKIIENMTAFDERFFVQDTKVQ